MSKIVKAKGTAGSNRTLHLISLNHATNDASVALLPTLYPVVLSLFGISLFQLGILVAAMYVTNVICQPITGQYSQRFEPRILLPAGIGLMAFSMVMLIFSTSFPTLLFSAIVLRIGSSFFHPVGISTVSKSYSGQKLDKSMGFQSAFGNFGIFAVFLVGAPIYFRFGWSAPFLIFVALDAFVALITFAKLGNVQSISNRSQKHDSKPNQRFLVSLPLFFLVGTFISGGANAVVMNYGNILLERSNFTITQADLLIAAWIGFAFIGAFYTGAMTRRLARGKVLISFYVIASVSVLSFSVFTNNLGIVVVSLLANGFAVAVTYPVIYSELASFLGPESDKTGAAFGVILSSQIIGSAVMGFFTGYVSGILGLSFSFEITALLLIVAALAAFIWKRKQGSFPLAGNPKIL
ncbi:MAG: MFS transporter [Nitrososphaerales archaeon]